MAAGRVARACSMLQGLSANRILFARFFPDGSAHRTLPAFHACWAQRLSELQPVFCPLPETAAARATPLAAKVWPPRTTGGAHLRVLPCCRRSVPSTPRGDMDSSGRADGLHVSACDSSGNAASTREALDAWV
eukprot:365303-Chlamydomonas_euryale.AAC.54